ncbi:secreted RxLR effector protein 78-like [Lactuca sativa]|uniref:secreted RxLR effector protein 78-like n=1 Tax=Lactuca sativa TaxID=4236 RepID=UPI001C68F8C4|nr:secreted RxLR effector protein 78-like [Lactuca sativa]
MIGKVVEDVQTAFIEGRNILDGPMIINEICTWAKKVKHKTFLLKVDSDKAFDSINWGYLESVMVQMGFGSIWLKWVKGCLSSARASVLLNGSATKEFPLSKGVRQGDPLSPFLFIIVMEGLNVAVKSACQKSLFCGIKIPKDGPSISHLFYADEAIFCGRLV